MVSSVQNQRLFPPREPVFAGALLPPLDGADDGCGDEGAGVYVPPDRSPRLLSRPLELPPLLPDDERGGEDARTSRPPLLERGYDLGAYTRELPRKPLGEATRVGRVVPFVTELAEERGIVLYVPAEGAVP